MIGFFVWNFFRMYFVHWRNDVSLGILTPSLKIVLHIEIICFLERLKLGTYWTFDSIVYRAFIRRILDIVRLTWHLTPRCRHHVQVWQLISNHIVVYDHMSLTIVVGGCTHSGPPNSHKIHGIVQGRSKLC